MQVIINVHLSSLSHLNQMVRPHTLARARRSPFLALSHRQGHIHVRVSTQLAISASWHGRAARDQSSLTCRLSSSCVGALRPMPLNLRSA